MKEIIKVLAENKNVIAALKKANIKNYNSESLFFDACSYISALEEGRLICFTGSNSTTKLKLKLKSCESNKNIGFFYRNYDQLLNISGISVSENGVITLKGSKADAAFRINYILIQSFFNMGMIDEEYYEYLKIIRISQY